MIAAGALAALLLATPALAQDWRAYENSTLSYAVDVPVGLGQVAETTEGLVIQSPTVTLTVFGLVVAPMDFATATQTAIASSEEEGFVLTDRRVTPDWARYGAVNGAQLQAVGWWRSATGSRSRPMSCATWRPTWPRWRR